MRFLSCVLLWLACLLLGAADKPEDAFQLEKSDAFAAPQQLCMVFDKRIKESSGLAVGIRNKNIYWTVNDSGNKALIYGINKKGETLVQLKSPVLGNIDWEDMSGFQLDGKAYLAVADIGDNAAVRPFCQIYVFEEPLLAQQKSIELKLAWTFIFMYPDGPRDCEGIAVDEQEQLFYLMSKRDVPARIYTLPLRPKNTLLVSATKLGELTTIPQPLEADLIEDQKFGKYRSQITAMDIDNKHQLTAINTYKHIYIYAKGDGTWLEAFQKKPTIIARPKLRQCESLCFDRDGNLYYGSEQVPWPIMTCQRLKQD